MSGTGYRHGRVKYTEETMRAKLDNITAWVKLATALIALVSAILAAYIYFEKSRPFDAYNVQTVETQEGE